MNYFDFRLYKMIKTDIYNKITLLICSAGVILIGFFSCIYEYILSV